VYIGFGFHLVGVVLGLNFMNVIRQGMALAIQLTAHQSPTSADEDEETAYCSEKDNYDFDGDPGFCAGG
jgi:hypothetical protein